VEGDILAAAREALLQEGPGGGLLVCDLDGTLIRSGTGKRVAETAQDVAWVTQSQRWLRALARGSSPARRPLLVVLSNQNWSGKKETVA